MAVTQEQAERLRKFVSELSDAELNELSIYFNHINWITNRRQEIEALRSSRLNVGKCYKNVDTNEYRMVVSPQGNNQYHVTAIRFHPKSKPHDMTAHTGVYHEIDYAPFEFMSWFFPTTPTCRDHGKWQEINQDEFISVMDDLYNNIKEKLLSNAYDKSIEEIEEWEKRLI